MSTDLSGNNSPDELSPKKGAQEILRDEVREGLGALERDGVPLFVSALSGGLDLGFSLFLMGVVKSHSEGLPDLLVRLLVANMYAVGFVFVILGRSELFTEQTTLAVLPVLRGKASVWALMRLWGIVYLANLIGAAVSAAIFSYTGPAIGIVKPEVLGEIGHGLVNHGAASMFMSALLAGWLMGLLSWMVAAARDTISQVVLVWIVTAAIGLGQLHHVVAGSVEVLGAVFSRQSVGFGDFFWFLLWATVGNAVGGSVFVSLIKYGHARPTEA